MFCKECGTKINEDEKFCSNCGTPVDVVEKQTINEIKDEVEFKEQTVVEIPKVEETTRVVEQQVVNKNTKGGKYILLGIVITITIAAALFVGYMIYQEMSDNSSTTSSNDVSYGTDVIENDDSTDIIDNDDEPTEDDVTIEVDGEPVNYYIDNVYDVYNGDYTYIPVEDEEEVYFDDYYITLPEGSEYFTSNDSLLGNSITISGPDDKWIINLQVFSGVNFDSMKENAHAELGEDNIVLSTETTTVEDMEFIISKISYIDDEMIIGDAKLSDTMIVSFTFYSDYGIYDGYLEDLIPIFETIY